jgi:antitoxin StbD
MAAAVIINIDAPQKVLDEREDQRIEAAAWERLMGFEQADAVSHEDMLARYAENGLGRVSS